MRIRIRHIAKLLILALAISSRVPAFAEDGKSYQHHDVRKTALTSVAIRKTSKGQELQTTFADGTVYNFPIKELPLGQSYFHWDTKVALIDTWDKNGKISDDEIGSRIKNGYGNQGGGIYVSQDSVDSSSYGRRSSDDKPIAGGAVGVFKPPSPIKYIENEDLIKIQEKVFEGIDSELSLPKILANAGLDSVNEILAKGGLDAIHGRKTTWWNFISKDSVSNLRRGDLDDVMKGWTYDFTLENLFSLDLTMGIKAHPIIGVHFPLVERVLEGKRLSNSEIKSLTESLANFEKLAEKNGSDGLKNSNLFQLLKKATAVFEPEVEQARAHQAF